MLSYRSWLSKRDSTWICFAVSSTILARAAVWLDGGTCPWS